MRLMHPHPAQERVLKGLGHPKAPQFLQVRCGRRWGKALAISTPLLTSEGWSTMGELRVGQQVFAPDGTLTPITFCSEVMYNHKCYRVTLSDGSIVDADAEHNWVTWTITKKGAARGKRIPGIVTTEQMAQTLRQGKRGDLVHAIKLTEPLEYLNVQLPIDPYTLGAWLGDGTASCGAITGVDLEVLDNIELAGYRISPRKDPQSFGILGLQVQLRDVGVLNNKHVPEQYFRGSVEQRRALLQGLMDTDGCVDPGGHCEFTNKNELLAQAVVELCRSLGYKPTIGRYKATLYGKDCGYKYRVHFTPLPGAKLFRIARKQERLNAVANRVRSSQNQYRMVTSIVEIPSVPVRCIQVEHPSHLFLCGCGLVATHNTSLGRLAALKVCVDFPTWSRVRMGQELILANSPMPKRVMIVCPDKQQAKELYWDSVLADLDGNPLVEKTNSTSLTVTFKGNRPQLMLKGANDREGDTLRGNDIPFGVFDEFQDWNYVAFTRVILPAMSSTRGSQGLIMGTPKGKGSNPMYTIYRMSESLPEQYHSYHFYTMDNPAIARVEIERAKATMSERDFKEEFMASFEDFPGRIYSELDERAVITGKDSTCYNNIRGLGVDWGDVNPAMAVWDFNPVTGETCYLDGWVNPTDTPVTFPEQRAIARNLCLKYQVKLTRCDPSRPADILELQQDGDALGIEGLSNAIAGDNAIKSGNSYVHGLIHQGKLKILDDPSNQQLQGMYVFDRMVAYHRKQTKTGEFLDEVAPGQDDHICDSSRYILYNPE